MEIVDFRKETSERSERQNWVLDELSASTIFYFSGFEGCNEDSSDVVTAIMDRASISITGDPLILPDIETVIHAIEGIEGKTLRGKINFCKRIGLTYTYILYNYQFEFVLRYEFNDDKLCFMQRYDSFASFSRWIQSIKKWNSGKGYENASDLPLFDIKLREAGCPWPTNIDGVVYDIYHNPVAILEFQNAKKTTVPKHFNNLYFFPDKITPRKEGKDEQRWKSQEILRLQTCLPHFTIVWSQDEDIVIFKQLYSVSFANDYLDNNPDYYQALVNFQIDLKRTPKDYKKENYARICASFQSYRYRFENGRMNKIISNPPLSCDEYTFPFLYGKRFTPCKKGSVMNSFEAILSQTISCPEEVSLEDNYTCW